MQSFVNVMTVETTVNAKPRTAILNGHFIPESLLFQHLSDAASLGVGFARCPMLGLPVLMSHAVAARCRTQGEKQCNIATQREKQCDIATLSGVGTPDVSM